jgi:hypothetical protein
VNYLPVISLPTSVLYTILNVPLGSLLAYNLLYPFYLALTGWAGFAFLRRHVDDLLLAIIGGAALAFNPLTVALASRGEVALLGVFALPLCMILWDRLLLKTTFARLVALVLGLYLTVTMSMQFWNVALTLLIPYAIFRAYGLSVEERARLLEYVVMGGLLFALLFLLFPASPFLWSTYGDQLAPIEVWQGALHLDDWYWYAFGIGGLAAVLASLTMPWQVSPDRRWWVGILGMNLACFALIDLAPLTLLGEFFRVPDNPALTRPAIFLFPVIISASVLILQAVRARLPEREALRYASLGGLAALVFMLSGWWGGLATSDVPHYNFYPSLANEQENYLIVDFPIGVDSIARRSLLEADDDSADDYALLGFNAESGRALAYMTQHHKRIIGGLTTHLLQDDLTPYGDSPLIRLLNFQPEDPDISINERVQLMRREVLRWRLGYIILRPEAVPPEFTDALRGWLHWIGSFCMTGSEGDLEFWRATWHPAGCPDSYRVKLGASDGVLAADVGWYPPEFIDVGLVRVAGTDGSLNAPITLWADRPATDYTLILRAQSPLEDQRVEVWANSESLGEIDLSSAWEDYRLTLPRLIIGQEGLLELELRHSRSQTIDGRPLTAVYQSVSLEPVSP